MSSVAAISQAEADRAYEMWIANPPASPERMASTLNEMMPIGVKCLPRTPGDAVLIARAEWCRRRDVEGWR